MPENCENIIKPIGRKLYDSVFQEDIVECRVPIVDISGCIIPDDNVNKCPNTILVNVDASGCVVKQL